MNKWISVQTLGQTPLLQYSPNNPVSGPPMSPVSGMITAASILPLPVAGSVVWFDGADPNGTGSVPSINTTLGTWVNKASTGSQYNATGVGSPTWSYGVLLNGNQNYTFPYSGTHANETGFIVLYISGVNTTNIYPIATSSSRTLTIIPTGGYAGIYLETTGIGGANYASIQAGYSSNTMLLVGYSISTSGSTITPFIYINPKLCCAFEWF
jgi:hypothetical protein